jgi:hypothetical protein
MKHLRATARRAERILILLTDDQGWGEGERILAEFYSSCGIFSALWRFC